MAHDRLDTFLGSKFLYSLVAYLTYMIFVLQRSSTLHPPCHQTTHAKYYYAPTLAISNKASIPASTPAFANAHPGTFMTPIVAPSYLVTTLSNVWSAMYLQDVPIPSNGLIAEMMLAVSLPDRRSDSVPPSSPLPLRLEPFGTLEEGIANRLTTPSSFCPFKARLAIFITSWRTSPVSSMAARNRASSLHKSQSPSFIARVSNRTGCSVAASNSSNVCRTIR